MRRRFGLLVIACLLAGGVAAAQHALDASLRLGAGRVNPKQPTPTMSRPIYTLNHRTGEFVYNRANAFNDPIYTIYQRRTIDLFDRAPTPSRANPGAQRAHTALLHRTPGARTASRSAHRSALRAPTYRVLGAVRAPSLKQPTYRVTRR
jgi:hypothetical protein